MLQPVHLLAHLAAETGDMRVGAGILLLPLLNPVEVAEQAATLDVITGGRFVLGVGLGYRAEENAAFDVPERRVRVFREKLDVVRRLLEGEEVTASGHGYRLKRARLAPRPPIWMAANNDSAVRRAARLADTWLVNPHAALAEVERQLALFRAERGSEPGELPMLREACVAPTDEEAVAVARPHLARKYDAYVDWGQSDVLPPTDTLRREWDALHAGRFLLGGPETALEQIARPARARRHRARPARPVAGPASARRHADARAARERGAPACLTARRSTSSSTGRRRRPDSSSASRSPRRAGSAASGWATRRCSGASCTSSWAPPPSERSGSGSGPRSRTRSRATSP